MSLTISQLSIGQRAIIKDFDLNNIPLKLLEMGCLPGNSVEIIQVAPFGCPLYLTINDSHLAIRLETAAAIEVEIPNQNKL